MSDYLQALGPYIFPIFMKIKNQSSSPIFVDTEDPNKSRHETMIIADELCLSAL